MTVRPVYLNLFKIRLPLTGMISFAHRVSGALMFLAIPAAVCLLDFSVRSEAAFRSVIELLKHPLSMTVLLLLAWSLVHHLVAGIRYLLIDFDIGVERQSSRASAAAVVVVEVLVLATLFAGAWL